MNKLGRRLAKCAVLLVFLALLITVETVTFAWLSTAWNGGEFAITTASTKVPNIQVWSKHEHTADNSDGWYTAYKDATDTTNRNKIVDAILTESGGELHAADEFSLYFGSVNNLVDEQDNPPVYVRALLTLPAMSTNTVELNYQLPTDYVKLYHNDGGALTQITTGLVSEVSGDTAWANLSNTDKYKFLQLDCFYSETNYGIDTKTHMITVSGMSDAYETFDASFDDPGDNGQIDIAPGTTEYSFTLQNKTIESKNVYVYFRFSVPTQTLRNALNNTNLREFMPVYLIFNTTFELTVNTSAYIESSAS